MQYALFWLPLQTLGGIHKCLVPFDMLEDTGDICMGLTGMSQDLQETHVLLDRQLETRWGHLRCLKWQQMPMFKQLNPVLCVQQKLNHCMCCLVRHNAASMKAFSLTGITINDLSFKPCLINY